MCRIAGKNYYSKRHIDEFFGTAVDIHSITKWVTDDDVEEAFSMSKSALRAYTYRHKIPTKREYGRTYFLAYFKKLADKKNSKWQHVYMHFRTFTQDKCTFWEINVDLCNRFREHLLTAPQGLRKRIRDASRYTSKKISLKLLFLSDIFLFPFVRQQVTVLA